VAESKYKERPRPVMLDARNWRGWTPLTVAAYHGRKEVGTCDFIIMCVLFQRRGTHTERRRTSNDFGGGCSNDDPSGNSSNSDGPNVVLY